MKCVSSWFQTYGFADVSRNLLVGAYPLDRRDVSMLAQMGVQRVLNLTEDSEYRDGERDEVIAAFADYGLEEWRMPLPDFGSLPPEALETAVRTIDEWLEEGTRIYVHCRAGWQRSVAVVAGVIAVRDGVEVDDAIDRIQVRKPSADPLPHQREDLHRWWASRANGSPTP